MENKSNIFQFSVAACTSWALQIHYGLVGKRLITAVYDFKGKTMVACPARITPLAQRVLALMFVADRAIARDDNLVKITNRECEIEKWLDMDVGAKAFIVKYVGASKSTHITDCNIAHDMWIALKSYYELQGDIEIANANAQLSAILMCETR